MQYNGSRGPAPTSVQRINPLNLGLRSASYSYGVDTPPRTASTDSNVPAWAAMPPPQQNGGPPNAFGANKDIGRKSGRISPQRIAPQRKGDMVSHHLLVETALLDCQNFELLTIQEVDSLKKEKSQLESRLQTTRKRLAMESKVRDAAQSLHRLYADDTAATANPSNQSKKRTSFHKSRLIPGSGSQKHVGQAGDELVESQQKVDNLLQILSGLESRRQYIESRLLRHTAAVLQLDHEERSQAQYRADTPQNDTQEDYDQNLVDSTISGLLNNKPRDSRRISAAKRSSSVPKVSDAKLITLQSRLVDMNREMRSMIQLARGDRSARDDESEPSSPANLSEDPVAFLEMQIEMVDKNLTRLGHECRKTREVRNNVGTHLIETGKQLHSLLKTFPDIGMDIPEPLPSTPGNLHVVLDYLDEATLSLQDVLQGQATQSSREKDETRKKADQYESTVTGLWEILGSSTADNEPFSLTAFRTRVQYLFEKAANVDVQTDILRRQIQQQRELNSKSDGEKEKQLSEAQTAKSELEQELSELREMHVAAEAESEATRAEMDKVMEELEQIRLAADANEDQKQRVLDQLSDHQSRTKKLEDAVAGYEVKVSEMLEDMRLASTESEKRTKQYETKVKDLNEQLTAVRSAHDLSATKLSSKQQESEDMEAEIVRLTTELTMAKAELEGAYGSRAERAKESNTAEVEELRRERDQLKGGEGRAAVLEQELRDLAKELQDMTRDSVAVERERDQLETLVDGLRARCDTLETRLGDEKVRWLGATSPTVTRSESGGREQTSAMVLRNEFKKMMRETRAENARLLRAEQEERKKLEAIIRGLKSGKPSENGVSGGLLSVKV